MRGIEIEQSLIFYRTINCDW